MKSSIHIGIWKRAKELLFPVTVTYTCTCSYKYIYIHVSFASISGIPVQPNANKE